MDWNWNSYKAAGKHVASYAAGGVTVALAFHLIDTSQGVDITTGVNSIVDGITSVAKGVGLIVGVATPFYTMWKSGRNASPTGQAAGLAAAVPETRIITTPEIAAAVPSEKVMSNQDVKVVNKNAAS